MSERVDFSANAPVYDRRHGAALAPEVTRSLALEAALTRGARVLDVGAGPGRVREACGERSVRLAREAEFRAALFGVRVGSDAAVRAALQAVVDKSLTLDPDILFNAGSHREAIRMRFRDFEELVKPTVADFGIPIRVS